MRRLIPWLSLFALLLATSSTLPAVPDVRPHPQKGLLPMARAAARTRPAPSAWAIDLPFPTVVARRPLLVLAVSFPGSASHLSLRRVAALYFGATDSVAAYFRDNSYGLFDLTGTVVGQGGDAPLLLPHPASYYASFGAERGTALMIRDAAALLARTHFDWAPFAVGHVIPYLAVVLALPESSDPNSPFYSAEYPDADLSVGGYVVANYDVTSEDDPLGIAAHEFGHMLNLIDLYDVRSGQYVVGDWSLYDGGAWNPDGQGTHPAEIDPWQKVVLGWLRPSIVDRSGTYVLPADETSPEVLAIPFPSHHELFLLENREPIGWDSTVPGRGLLIWKIDTAIANPSSAYWENDVVNTPGPGGPPHDGIVLVDADHSGDLASGGGAGDPFPGSAGVRFFSDHTTPSAYLLDGNPSHILVEVESPPARLMTVRVVFLGGAAEVALDSAPHPVVGLPLPVEVRGLAKALGSRAVLLTPFGEAPLSPGPAGFSATVVPKTPGIFTFTLAVGGRSLAQTVVDVVPALPYVDVSPAAPYYRTLATAYVEGILDGIAAFGGPRLRPLAPLSLADLLRVALRLEGVDLPPSAVPVSAALRRLAQGRGLLVRNASLRSPVTFLSLAPVLASLSGTAPERSAIPELVAARLLPPAARLHPSATVGRAEALVLLLRAWAKRATAAAGR